MDGAPSGSLDGGDGRAVLEGHRYHAGLSRMGLTSQSRLRQDLKARAVAFGLDPTGCVEREECLGAVSVSRLGELGSRALQVTRLGKGLGLVGGSSGGLS